MSEKTNSDKLFSEGVFTIYNEIDAIKESLREMLRPNGTRTNPARTCYDLFLCHPSTQEGYYWIDPNLGSVDDAIEVFCAKPGCSCYSCNTATTRRIAQRENTVEVSP